MCIRDRVSDDGVGMTEETCANITQVESSTGLGIAVKNVHDRMIGFFGPDAQMVYTLSLIHIFYVRLLRGLGCAAHACVLRDGHR